MSIQYREISRGAVFVLDNFFTADECQKHLETGEECGFKPATMKVDDKNKVTSDAALQKVRNNERALIESQPLADNLWDRLKPFLKNDFAQTPDGFRAVSVSRKFSYYRYTEGQKFGRHLDGYDYGSMRYDGQEAQYRSKLTLMVYLSDDFEGGKTQVFAPTGKEAFSITPRKGK
ncbi:hypothetical protein PROFUN_10282 [Planoprotostelium fungivorum]|uniref:Prolyl 4-hydroxylase alpha subunit Fe(2+) 2OG dioxygenase domain-containing protein n=1 Tax=Planoprotostelium fungivorum TaxID=1890364 RepID=A0A2P6MRQ2_9EUKA|nr:hypothetical protein PROFUN_10282 [Planoprotostelium fungivorum]